MSPLFEYPFPANYFETAGGKLHYIDVGQGPLIVMVHGNPTWSYMYRNLINNLQDRYRIIAIDHLGCGKSDKPQKYNYRLADHIKNLDGLLGHLHVKRFSLVVHDWGGAIGIGCALKRLKDLQAMVLLNTAAFRSNRIPRRIRICRTPLLGAVLVRGLNGFAGAARYMAASRPLPKRVAEGFVAPYDNWQNRVAVHKFVLDIPLSPTHPSYQTLVQIENGLESLRQNNIPVFIGWGGKDFCFDEHFFAEWVARLPEAQTQYFPDGGHYILEDKKEELIAEIRSFFMTQDW